MTADDKYDLAGMLVIAKKLAARVAHVILEEQQAYGEQAFTNFAVGRGFGLWEMALTAARKARLQVMVEAGDAGAQCAMDLHDNPTKFLSVVQIGITSIGVLNGIVGEAALAASSSATAASREPAAKKRSDAFYAAKK